MDLSDKDLTDTILRKANLTNANITGLDLVCKGSNCSQYLSGHGSCLIKDLTNDTILRGADLSNSALPDNGYLSEKNFASIQYSTE